MFKKRELIFAEGEIDTTYYLLQKGEALLRFQCPRDGTPQQVRRETGWSGSMLLIDLFSCTRAREMVLMKKLMSRWLSIHIHIHKQVAVETLRTGTTFGEVEMMIETDGTVLPRATSCECK